MALITTFHHQPDRDIRFSTDTDCGWTYAEIDGSRILSLKTFGSEDRQVPGKGSQNIELDETSAAALLTIIRKAFPELV